MRDPAVIDRIVQGVLAQLGAPGGEGAHSPRPAEIRPGGRPAAPRSLSIDEHVITAGLLAERANGAAVVEVGARALVTPAAWDYLREHGLTLRRCGEPNVNERAATLPHSFTAPGRLAGLLIVVRSTPAVERLWESLQESWRRELLGCPDDAARLAISALSRGETSLAVILAAQTHRAACLANRHETVKAVAVRDAAEVRLVRRQLRANVWCADPDEQSWFELRNLFRAIEKSETPISPS